MLDPVDIDLNRELARIEAQDARDVAIEDFAHDLLTGGTDADLGRFVRQHLGNDALWRALWDVAQAVAEESI